jgi:hypothetical protein
LGGLATRINDLVQVSEDPKAALYVLQILPPDNPRLSGCAKRILGHARETAATRWTGISTLRKIEVDRQIELMMGIAKMHQPGQVPLNAALDERKDLLKAIVKQPNVEHEMQHSVMEQMRFFTGLLKDFARDDRFDLSIKMRDPNPMIRWLAVLAAAQRRVPCEEELVRRLKDPVPAIRDAARLALVRLARGVDFGPTRSSGPTPVAYARERDQAIANWQAWLKSQRRESAESLENDTER